LYKLAQSPEYRGETWKVPAETLDSEFSARAVIAVQTAKSAKPGYQVRVTTYYPDTKRARIMVEREVVVEAPAKDKAGKNSK